jgi:long-chain fatty acid transport protein
MERVFISRALLLVAVCAIPLTSAGQSGHVLNGVGPVDQAMSGAGMAYPQEVSAALHWNPASISALPGSAVGISTQLLFPTTTLSSTVNQGAFGPFGPPITLSGETSSTAGPFPIPSLGFVYRPETSRLALGLNAFGVGGFGVEYELDPTNPILTPQAPNGLGFGALNSQYFLFQVAPTVAYEISDGFSVGISPTLDIAILEVNPFPGANPDDANGDGFPSYPDGPSSTTTGFGIQAGVHYSDPSGIHVGASFKSVQAFSSFDFDSEDESGNARTFQFELDYPMIISAGVAYTGIDKLMIAGDIRYIDFENTDGFDTAQYGPTGAVTGFGWNSIVVFAAGLQYEVAERLPLRVGFSTAGAPIDDENSFFNVASPALVQHRVSAGASYGFSDKVMASLALQYGLAGEVDGPWVTPAGANPGTSVSSELSTFFVALGVQIGL